MVKFIFTIFVLLIALNSFAQNDTIIDAKTLSEEQLTNISGIASKNGWVLVKSEDGSYVSNYSNKDYILFFSKSHTEPKNIKFLIEFSDIYSDSTYGGIDLVSSESQDNNREVEFILDGKKSENPFINFDKIKFQSFIETLKKTKVLTISIYDKNNSGELELNRSIEFKTNNRTILDFLL